MVIKILNVQRKSFVVRQLYQQQRLRLAGLGHMKLIPNVIEETHRDVAKFRSRHNGVKDLPPYQHLKAGEIHRAQDALFSRTTVDICSSHRINNKESRRQENQLETTKMKGREIKGIGKYLTTTRDHVSQFQRDRDIVEKMKDMAIGSQPENLNYKTLNLISVTQKGDQKCFCPDWKTWQRSKMSHFLHHKLS